MLRAGSKRGRKTTIDNKTEGKLTKTDRNPVLSPQLLRIEGAVVHRVEGQFARGSQDGGGLGEEVTVRRLPLDGSDEHGVASVLVRTKSCMLTDKERGVIV